MVFRAEKDVLLKDFIDFSATLGVFILLFLERRLLSIEAETLLLKEGQQLATAK